MTPLTLSYLLWDVLHWYSTRRTGLETDDVIRLILVLTIVLYSFILHVYSLLLGWIEWFRHGLPRDTYTRTWTKVRSGYEFG